MLHITVHIQRKEIQLVKVIEVKCILLIFAFYLYLWYIGILLIYHNKGYTNLRTNRKESKIRQQ